MRRRYERIKDEIKKILRSQETEVVRVDGKGFILPQKERTIDHDGLSFPSLSTQLGGKEMTRRNDKERSIPELKSDIRKLCYLVIRELMNDFSIYNRFPELKEHIKGVKLNGNLYDKIYYESLLAELKGDFIIGLCYLYSIAYVDFVNHCLTNRVMYLEDIKQGNPRSVRIKFSDKKIRDKTIARAVEKSLKGIRK